MIWLHDFNMCCRIFMKFFISLQGSIQRRILIIRYIIIKFEIVMFYFDSVAGIKVMLKK